MKERCEPSFIDTRCLSNGVMTCLQLEGWHSALALLA